LRTRNILGRRERPGPAAARTAAKINSKSLTEDLIQIGPDAFEPLKVARRPGPKTGGLKKGTIPSI
jgi:hypothetical protein